MDTRKTTAILVRFAARALTLLALAGLALHARPAMAAVPSQLTVEGVLLSTGGPAADGIYQIGCAIYATGVGGLAVWSEPQQAVAVKGGLFNLTLGKIVPLDAKALAGVAAPWLGLTIEGDPELARRALTAVPFALRAGVADMVECSGCIGAGQVDAKVLQPYAKTSDVAKVGLSGNYGDLTGVPDLGVYAKTGALAKVATSGAYADLTGLPVAPVLAAVAKSGSYLDLLNQPLLAGVAKTGDYADLNGKPVLAKVGAACGSGLVIKGFAADGTYVCVQAMDVSALPPDGLDEISGGLLTTQFDDIYASTNTPLDIPDNSPLGAINGILVPDVGITQGMSVSVDIVNSDITKLTVTLTAPDDTKYVLHGEGGGAGVALKTTFPVPTKFADGGNLDAWIGKNPKGKWTLTVIDSGFQNNATDGQLQGWSLGIKTLSATKVGAKGAFQFKVTDTPPLACTAQNFGATYASNKDKSLYICNGTEYFPLSLSVVGTQTNPAASCKDVLIKSPASKDGVYWITAGATTFPVYCDMTTAGGGWTLVMHVHPQDGSSVSFTNTTFWTADKEFGQFGKHFTNDYKSPASYLLPGSAVLVEVTTPGDFATVVGWKAWNMQAKAFDAFFDSAANTTQTSSVIGAEVSNVYAYEPIIKNGNQLQSNRAINPNSDRVRLGVDGYPAQGDDNQPGLGTQMNEAICGAGSNCYRYRDVELWVNSTANLWCTAPGPGSYGWIGTDGGCGGSCGSCEATKNPAYAPYWTYRMFVR